MITVLLVDDTADELVPTLQNSLGDDYSLKGCVEAEKALAAIEKTEPNLVLLDLHFPGDAVPDLEVRTNTTTDFKLLATTTGFRLLAEIREQYPEIPVLMITGVLQQRDIPLEIFEVQPHGQISKPDSLSDSNWPAKLKKAINDAIQAAQALDNLVEELEKLDFVVGQTRAMVQVARMIRLAAGGTGSVTVYGAEGTGRMFTAQTIHRLSQCDGEFVFFNCKNEQASLPEALAQATRGTLYLRDIEFLQEEQLGELLRCPDDIRLISSTSSSYNDILYDGHLTASLVDQLHDVVISLPLLRDRLADIDALFRCAVQHANAGLENKLDRTLTDDVKQALSGHQWRHNIQEFNRVIRNAVTTVAADNGTIVLERYIAFAPEPNQNADNGNNATLIERYDQISPSGRYQFLLDQDGQDRALLLVAIIRRLARERGGARPGHLHIYRALDPELNRETDAVRQFVCTTLSKAGLPTSTKLPLE